MCTQHWQDLPASPSPCPLLPAAEIHGHEGMLITTVQFAVCALEETLPCAY